mmetsp:Transcript_64438/g.207561  ORF Transcript_64438/g.207561 Transcript_64438/m.207561 type:complete len:186 (-) Transcript_64438:121-678(-)
MEPLRRELAILCLLAAALGADGVSTGLALKMGVQRSAAKRVDLVAQSLFALERTLQLPTNITKDKEAAVLKALQEHEHKLEQRLADITQMDKQEESEEQQTKLQNLTAAMKPSDKAMMEKMDEWDKRMNRKTRLGAMDVISKLKNTIHLIKKGALRGNKEAQASLNKVLEKMGIMAGQGANKFLH